MSDIDKTLVPTKLLWVDLEMTGLDPGQDLILEVAAEITDFNLKTLESYESRIFHERAAVATRMQANTWWREFPQNRDDFLDHLSQGKAPAQVVKDLTTLIDKHFGTEPAVLAGNSIHNDRAFIKTQWPSLDIKLHYRMLDVSSFKVLMQGRYGVIFEKQQPHRAFDDIQASIAELQFYLDWLKQQ